MARRIQQILSHLQQNYDAHGIEPCSTSSDDVKSLPLYGIRIIDCSQHVSGPMSTHILADQGADVIKVEAPSGDHARIFQPLFSHINRNKRSVCINLKSPEGVETLKELIKTADVFLHNFRPGVTEKLGVDHETLRVVNPKLIYANVNGFGNSGPYSRKRAYDPIVQAASGLASIQSDHTGRPRLLRLIIPDMVTAITASQAITAALLKRTRTGEGETVDVAMLDVMVEFVWSEGMANYIQVDKEIPLDFLPKYVRDMVYKTKDNKYITCGAVSNKEWAGLCKALKRDEWLTDERFTTPPARKANAALRFQFTEDAVAEMDAKEILERLDTFDVPSSIINHPRQNVMYDPQVIHNELIFDYTHPKLGEIRSCRPPTLFSGSKFQFRHYSPEIGQHTRDVLQDIMSKDKIDKLLETDAIRQN